MNLHIRPDARPPPPLGRLNKVPTNLHDQVLKQLEDDVTLRVLEKVPKTKSFWEQI